MKKKLSFSLLIIITAFFFYGGKKKETLKIPPRYQKWLEEEVVYIIAPIERDVFLQLQTDRERDLFQEAFWKHRDPTPGTPANEFRQEHYRRINYANHFFGGGYLSQAGELIGEGFTSSWEHPMTYKGSRERLWFTPL